MKKAVIAVFSVSLTAGTLYLTYSKVKDHLIKKLLGSWEAECKKRKKELSASQIDHLKKELDKLFVWDVKWLSNYSAKLLSNPPEKELVRLTAKIKEKKILEKADLKTVDILLIGT